MPAQTKWQDREVVLNGLKFHYLDWGNQGKRPMLLLHGGRQDAHSWDEFSEAVCKDYHVYALDQRGHGDSDWSPDGKYRLDDHMRDIHGWVQHLGVRDFILIGLSMGGRNATSYTVRYSEEVGALVAVDVGPEGMREGVENIRRFAQEANVMDSLEDFVAAAHKFNPRRPIEQLRERIERRVKQLPDGKWTWKYDTRPLADAESRVNRQPTPEEREARWAEVRRIKCPTLVVRGALSDILPAEVAERMTREIPDCRLATVEKAGHTVPGDNPPGFYKAVKDWLEAKGL